jgi:hypothetical protein
VTVWKNGFVGQTVGVTVTGANSGASGSAFTFVSTGGTRTYQNSIIGGFTSLVNVQYSAASGTAQYTERNVFNNLNLSDSFYLDTPASNPSATTQIYSARTAAGQSYGLNYRSDGRLQIVDGNSGLGMAFTTAALPISAHIRVDIKGFSDASAGTVDVDIRDSANVLIQNISNTAVLARGGNITNVRQGKVTTSAYTGVIAMTQINGEDGRTTFMGPWVAGGTVNLADLSFSTDSPTPFSIDSTVTINETASTSTDTLTPIIGVPSTVVNAYAFDTVGLPPGSWVQVSGPSVTLVGNTFTAPATISGATLSFTYDVFTLTVMVAPHNIWLLTSAGPTAIEPSLL